MPKYPEGHEYHVEAMSQLDAIQWMLEERGWAAQPVPPATEPEPRAGYTYTVGLEALVGHPEMVVFGHTPAAASGLLGLAVEHLRSGGQIPLSQPFTGLLDGGLRAMLIPVDAAAHLPLFGTLPQIYGDQPWRMTQFVWPHRNGAFPWEDDWPGELRLAQPIIGT